VRAAPTAAWPHTAPWSTPAAMPHSAHDPPAAPLIAGSPYSDRMNTRHTPSSIPVAAAPLAVSSASAPTLAAASPFAAFAVGRSACNSPAAASGVLPRATTSRSIVAPTALSASGTVRDQNGDNPRAPARC
jgi:hypothetical protein